MPVTTGDTRLFRYQNFRQTDEILLEKSKGCMLTLRPSPGCGLPGSHGRQRAQFSAMFRTPDPRCRLPDAVVQQQLIGVHGRGPGSTRCSLPAVTRKIPAACQRCSGVNTSSRHRAL